MSDKINIIKILSKVSFFNPEHSKIPGTEDHLLVQKVKEIAEAIIDKCSEEMKPTAVGCDKESILNVKTMIKYN